MGNNNNQPNPSPVENQNQNIDRNSVNKNIQIIENNNLNEDNLIFQRKRFYTESNKKSNINLRKIECELNIYVYSNQDVNKSITKLLNDFNSPIIKCKTEIIKNFSKENSDKIINKFKEDYNQNKFKNVLIIPINSIMDFLMNNIIIDKKEIIEKNIFFHFRKLCPEEQPFFLIIDYEEKDFSKKIETIEKNFVLKKYYELKRKDKDFDISFEINLKREDLEKIEILKKRLLIKKQNEDDFEISINDKYFYQNLFGEESKKLEIFLSEVFADININFFKINLVLINQNSDFLEELSDYEKLEREITKIDFIYYSIIRKDKFLQFCFPFGVLNERNFEIKRSKKSQKYQLLKYASFYNNFDDILYSDQISYYPFKINIGVGGFIGSGKSILINTILEEKRCPEGKENNKNKDSIYEYTLKEFCLNFIEFPGFNSKLDNTEQIINKIKLKILEMSQKKEKLHCFLFCINYEENLSEENLIINKIFETLFEINTRIFFIVTQSEKSDSEGFKQFKGKILNVIEIVKNKYSQKVIDIILGGHIENEIIPICTVKKILKEKTIKPFGLDELFIHLFDFFSIKIIKNYNIVEDEFNDKEIQKLINEHFLLKIFKSKNDLLNALKTKMEYDASNFFYKVLILNPNYLINFSKDIIYKIYDKIFNQFLINYKYIIDKLEEKEKLRFYNISNLSRVNKDIIDRISNNPEFDKIKKGLIDTKELINSQQIYLFSKEINNLIIGQFCKIIKEKYFLYFFEDIIITFNMSIAALYVLSECYRELYVKNEKENEKEKK